MTNLPRRWLLLLALLASLLAGGVTLAQTGTFDQTALSVGTSGGVVSSGDTTLQATIGQAALAGGSSGTVSIAPGFSSQIARLGVQTPAITNTVYLPVIVK